MSLSGILIIIREKKILGENFYQHTCPQSHLSKFRPTPQKLYPKFCNPRKTLNTEKERRGEKNAVNSGHCVLPATPKGPYFAWTENLGELFWVINSVNPRIIKNYVARKFGTTSSSF